MPVENHLKHAAGSQSRDQALAPYLHSETGHAAAPGQLPRQAEVPSTCPDAQARTDSTHGKHVAALGQHVEVPLRQLHGTRHSRLSCERMRTCSMQYIGLT